MEEKDKVEVEVEEKDGGKKIFTLTYKGKTLKTTFFSENLSDEDCE